jgi:methionyl-tRNA synthetase
MKSFYVTTPIYYVNDAPHIGHAYTTLLADVLARYHRLLGVPTHFLTGTDEHGQKVYETAMKLGITPQEQCDRTVVRFQRLWEKMEITHDDFIRTTEERHKRVVRAILADLWERGEIYKGDYEGWYSVSEERFYTELELVDGKSPEGKPVQKIVESNYFFRMSKYQDWLIEYIESHPEFIQPDFRRNETLGFLRKPLGDLCISRPKRRLPWGIELPFDKDYVCYVWVDALVNYISAVGYLSDPERFNFWWPATYHLIGKDILTTHSVYWPTLLRAIGLPQPRTIFAHGWWLTGQAKMSKSEGNVTNPMDMADKYGVDALRYFLMAEMRLGHDAAFSEEAFVARYNSDLANDLGNLVSRSIKMARKHFDDRIPPPAEAGIAEAVGELREACMTAVEEMQRHLREMSLDRGIHEVLTAVRQANRFFDHMAPWKLLKEGDRERAGGVLYAALECLRIVSGLLYPVIPRKMSELRRALGIPEEALAPRLEALQRWGELPAGGPLADPGALFPRIKPLRPPTPTARGARPGKQPAAEGVKTISIDTFAQVQLRVARIERAERVEGADRLLKLSIDLGSEKRTIVAGIARWYSPEELEGKLIIVVANLEPATIRGLRSEGMLLAAQKGKRLRLLTVDGEIPPGSKIS